ncbi:MAG: hypothetical protein V1904_05655 [Bacteroidota bacterium]
MLIITISFVLALVSTEIILRFIIKYPTLGVEKKVKGLTDYIYKPYSQYWDVESGNHLYRRNNIGVQGTDISLNNKNIYVLGTSYVEARQIPPDKIATSVFQNKLQDSLTNFQVINLGGSGQDAYDAYFRITYYEKLYSPDYVILLLDGLYTNYFKRHKHPLDFRPEPGFGDEVGSLTSRALIFLRNNSVLINLIARSLKKSADIDIVEEETNQNSIVQVDNKIPEELLQCIGEYHLKYKNKFICLSIIDNDTVNLSLESYCNGKNIFFEYNNEINIKCNKYNGKGHLTAEGNKLLGDFIYESFIKFYKK